MGVCQLFTAMAAVNKIFELSVSGWTVGGILHATGIHKGAVQYRFKAPKTTQWLTGGAGLPVKLGDAIATAKAKVKATLRARLSAAEAKASKSAPKASKSKKAPKAASAPKKKGKGLVKKASGKK